MNKPTHQTSTTAEVDWSTDDIVARRDRFYSASQRKFVPYATPLILKRGAGQYLWDEKGNQYTDLLGMNLCISVGHAHPLVVEAAREQLGELFDESVYLQVILPYAPARIARVHGQDDGVCKRFPALLGSTRFLQRLAQAETGCLPRGKHRTRVLVVGHGKLVALSTRMELREK